MSNDDWEGAAPMNKALKALATSVRPISASRVKAAATTALKNVKVKTNCFEESGGLRELLLGRDENVLTLRASSLSHGKSRV